MIALAMLPACGGGGGSDIGPVAPTDPVVAEGFIGPSGGSLVVTTGDDAGLSLVVPAGAVPVATQFRILRDITNGEVPSTFPVYRLEPASLDFSATPVIVTVPASSEFFASGPANLTLFARADQDSSWLAMANTVLDATARTVSATVPRLGDFLAWEGNLHRLFTQELRIYDPSVPVPTEFLYGTQVAVANGTIPRTVGGGSLASFWNSSAADNVLIVHGVFGSPLDFLGGEDLIENLGVIRSNVVLLSYPSARGIAYAANELYDLIVQNRQPGFGCSIVGHSIGGLIGRYLLEKSANDPARRGFQVGQASLASVVDQLIMLGVPNAGAQSSTLPFTAIQANLPVVEQGLLQVGHDLSEQPDSLPLVMNASYIDNATRYHVIYGDLGFGSDGVVSAQSALALPLTPPETTTMFIAAHDDLHRRATSLGLAVWMGTLLQSQ